MRMALAARPRPLVLFGHLLPDVLEKPEARLVAVLRCEPTVLRKRLLKRGYPSSKIVENLEAELIGLLLDECLRAYGPALVREYDTTSASPEEVAASIARDTKSSITSKRTARWIDWTLRYDSSSKLTSLLSGNTEPLAST